MARKPRTSKGKTMQPNFFVFCEGDSEVTYVGMLRTHYRLPIHIIARKTLLNITPALVSRIRSSYTETSNDRTFLMYDLDVPTVLARLQKIPDATLLCSNPCFELWLLLHFEEQKGNLSSSACVAKLKKAMPSYTKGVLRPEEQTLLIAHAHEASLRAKQLAAYENPSTTIYELIEALDEIKEDENIQPQG